MRGKEKNLVEDDEILALYFKKRAVVVIFQDINKVQITEIPCLVSFKNGEKCTMNPGSSFILKAGDNVVIKYRKNDTIKGKIKIKVEEVK